MQIKTLGQKILDARLQAELTQCEVAKLIAGSPSYFCRVEKDHEGLSVSYLLRLAKALGTTGAELLEGIE